MYKVSMRNPAGSQCPGIVTGTTRTGVIPKGHRDDEVQAHEDHALQPITAGGDDRYEQCGLGEWRLAWAKDGHDVTGHRT